MGKLLSPVSIPEGVRRRELIELIGNFVEGPRGGVGARGQRNRREAMAKIIW